MTQDLLLLLAGSTAGVVVSGLFSLLTQRKERRFRTEHTRLLRASENHRSEYLSLLAQISRFHSALSDYKKINERTSDRSSTFLAQVFAIARQTSHEFSRHTETTQNHGMYKVYHSISMACDEIRRNSSVWLRLSANVNGCIIHARFENHSETAVHTWQQVDRKELDDLCQFYSELRVENHVLHPPVDKRSDALLNELIQQLAELRSDVNQITSL